MRPIASRRNAEVPAWRRSWRQSRARAGRPPSATMLAQARRAGESRRIGHCRKRTMPAAARCRPKRAWRDAHPQRRRATGAHSRGPRPDRGSPPRSQRGRATTGRHRTHIRAAADPSPRAHRGQIARRRAGALLRRPRSRCPESADRRGPRVVAAVARTVLPALRATAREMHFARARAHRPTVAAAGRAHPPRIRRPGADRVARAPAARQRRHTACKARAGPGPASPRSKPSFRHSAARDRHRRRQGDRTTAEAHRCSRTPAPPPRPAATPSLGGAMGLRLPRVQC